MLDLDDADTVVVSPDTFNQPTPADTVLRLRSTDQARRAMRRSALRYAAKLLRRFGYDGASLRLEIHIEALMQGAPDALPEFR